MPNTKKIIFNLIDTANGNIFDGEAEWAEFRGPERSDDEFLTPNRIDSSKPMSIVLKGVETYVTTLAPKTEKSTAKMGRIAYSATIVVKPLTPDSLDEARRTVGVDGDTKFTVEEVFPLGYRITFNWSSK